MEERRRNPPKGPHLITRDMLIAAGALNVKREQRKPKEEAPRPLFGQLDDEDLPAEEQRESEDAA